MSIKINSRFNPSADFVPYQGDCRELLQTIPDNYIKLVVTSPPYNIGKEYEKKLDIQEYVEQQSEVIKECVRVLDDTGSICWQVGNYASR
jgi:adenine-specific DNA-methyltransferase